MIILLVSIYACEQPGAEKAIKKPLQSLQQNAGIEKPFLNPSLIFGSSFGQFFQSLYRNNQYEQMLCFTSKETINKFSREHVLKYYKQDFRFDYVLGKQSNISIEDGITTLTFSNASIYGTRRKIRTMCLVENDSVKIILNSLSNKPFE